MPTVAGIRRGMAPGYGGEIVASAVTPVVVQTTAEVQKHFRIKVI
jgi:hypothetical protein